MNKENREIRVAIAGLGNVAAAIVMGIEYYKKISTNDEIIPGLMHNSIGGYDLFYSELQEDGNWSKPKNMKYPINTVEDDIYYVLSADGKRAYYSSYSKEGYGGRDIYIMHLSTLPERSTIVVKGTVKIKDSDEASSLKSFTWNEKNPTRQKRITSGKNGFSMTIPL